MWDTRRESSRWRLSDRERRCHGYWLNIGDGRSRSRWFCGWLGLAGVYDRLKKDGYSVEVVQNPTLSLEGDVATTNQVIDAQSEPVILVGHSYGGR